MEERSVGFLQCHRRIVYVRWLGGDAVEFENFKRPALELFHRFRADVESAEVKVGNSSRDRVNRRPQRRCLDRRTVQKHSATTMRSQLGQGHRFSRRGNVFWGTLYSSE